MKNETDQKFMDMIMEKICEKSFIFKNINKGDEIYEFNIDDFIKDVSHPTDPEEGGIDLEGLGPIFIEEYLLSALQREEKIEILIQNRMARITSKGKDYCKVLGF